MKRSVNLSSSFKLSTLAMVLVVGQGVLLSGCSSHSAMMVKQVEQQSSDQQRIQQVMEALQITEARLAQAQAENAELYAPNDMDEAKAALGEARRYSDRIQADPKNVNESISLFFGETMGEKTLALFRRDHMGVVFQSFHLIPTMTALENVAVPLELAGQTDAFARARAELEAVGLAARADHYPAQMSGGEQQRVALARALAPRPAILLADEPTGNLDGANGAIVMDMLMSLQARYGTTLVLVTHAPELAARCGRVLRLKDGRIDPAEIAA